MNQYNKLKQVSIFTASALALAVASVSHAIDFEVGDTKVSVYGYAKLDMIYDVDSKMNDGVSHSDIAYDDEASSDGHTQMHAYQSRVGFQTTTPVSGSKLVTRIEGDFYTDDHDFRLRHAYGSWNGVLAGQTWTNFSSALATTPTIDFTGLTGNTSGARHTQFRYTTGNFSVALENPDGLGGQENTDMLDEEDPAAKSELPDLTLRFTDKASAFKYSFSGVVRQLEYDADEIDDPAQRNAAIAAGYDGETTIGWGVAFEAAYDVTPTVTVRGGVVHGKGLGTYLNVSLAPDPAYVNSDGDLEAIETSGGSLGTSITVGPGTLNLAYAVSTANYDDEDRAALGDKDEKWDSLYVNYIWSPAERINYGIEVGHHSRETIDGRDGDATRIQGMVMYSF